MLAYTLNATRSLAFALLSPVTKLLDPLTARTNRPMEETRHYILPLGGPRFMVML
jgi:hypothetical protein